MAFKKGDVFHVVDTLHNGVVGSWQVFRMGERENGELTSLYRRRIFHADPFLSGMGSAAEQVKKGVIPNKARAEEIATKQFNAAKKEQNANDGAKSSGNFFRRKREKSRARSKSLGKVRFFARARFGHIMHKHTRAQASLSLWHAHTFNW